MKNVLIFKDIQFLFKMSAYKFYQYIFFSINLVIYRSPGVCESVNDTGIEYHTKVRAQQPSPSMLQPYYCKSKSVITVDYTPNPALTVYLSLVSSPNGS